jgi:hypothetical protein
MAITRIQVGDRSGRIIADIAPAVSIVSWILNKAGQCKFVMARTDSKATKDVLAVANRVYIEFDNGSQLQLIDVQGIIDDFYIEDFFNLRKILNNQFELDLIVHSHTLEHIISPFTFLYEVHSCLKRRS